MLGIIAEFHHIEVAVGAAHHVSLGAASHAPYMLNRNDSQARKSSQVETTKAGILNCFRGLECDG